MTAVLRPRRSAALLALAAAAAAVAAASSPAGAQTPPAPKPQAGPAAAPTAKPAPKPAPGAPGVAPTSPSISAAAPAPAVAEPVDLSSLTVAQALKRLAAAADPADPAADIILAQWDQTQIKRQAVAPLLAHLPPEAQTSPVRAVYPQLLEQLIDQRLVARAARAKGLAEEPDLRAQLDRLADRLFQQIYLERLTGPLTSAASVAEALTQLSATPDAVAGRVGSDAIRYGDLARVLADTPPESRAAPPATLYPAVRDALISPRKARSAALQDKLADDPAVKRRLTEIEDLALQKHYLDRVLRRQVTDAAVKARYDHLIATTPPPDEIRARHILVKTEAEARAAIADLLKGAEFPAVAKARSIDLSAKDGGDLAYFTAGDVDPEFAAAAFALKPKEWTRTPVKTKFGWHVILATDRRKAEPQPFETVKDVLTARLSQETLAETLQELRAGVKIARFDLDGRPMTPGLKTPEPKTPGAKQGAP